MKTEIYYFSGTGNSLAVARMLSKDIPNSTVLSISSIMEKRDTPVITADRVGFVFPCYCHRLPAQVEQFIKTARFKENSIAFSVVTHNGEQGSCGQRIEGLLKGKGVELTYSNHLLMPGNSIAADGFTNTPEEQTRRLNNSVQAVKDMAQDIDMGKVYLYPNPDNFWLDLKGKTLHRINNAMKIHRKFHTDGNCTGCGICTRVCPVRNISLKDLPEWGEDCEKCLACIHWCPSRSIQINKGTKNRIRYHHPQIKVNEIAYR